MLVPASRTRFIGAAPADRWGKSMSDLAAAVDNLPIAVPSEVTAEAWQATGTEGAHVPLHVHAADVSCVRLITDETGRGGEARPGDQGKPLEMQGSEGDCASLRVDDGKGERGDLNPQPPDPQSGALTS